MKSHYVRFSNSHIGCHLSTISDGFFLQPMYVVLVQERQEREEELKVKEAELLRGNPLLNNPTSFNVKRRCDSERFKSILVLKPN